VTRPSEIPVSGRRIAWRTMSCKEIERVVRWSDLHGDLSLLKAARAALRRLEGWGR
jgi:hypothetical protein